MLQPLSSHITAVPTVSPEGTQGRNRMPATKPSVTAAPLPKTAYPERIQNEEKQDTGPRFSSVAQSCLTLCDPMDYSMPGLPVHHQPPEFIQTHAIQPSHPLSSLSPLAFNLSQHQGL